MVQGASTCVSSTISMDLRKKKTSFSLYHHHQSEGGKKKKARESHSGSARVSSYFHVLKEKEKEKEAGNPF